MSQVGVSSQRNNLTAEWGSSPQLSQYIFPHTSGSESALRLCPSPGNTEKWQRVLERQERSIHDTKGGSTEADPKGVETTDPCAERGPHRAVTLENQGSWSHRVFRFANLNSSFNTRGGEKAWREEKKHSLEFVLRNQTKYPLYPKEIVGDDYLRTLFGPGEGTKLSYNILTLPYEYQFISLSVSAVLV